MKTNKEILLEARLSLKNKWSMSILVSLSYALFFFITQFLAKTGTFIKEQYINDIIIIFLQLILVGPFILGLSKYFLEIFRNENPAYKTMYSGFNDFKRALITYLLTYVFIVARIFLLIIPAFIAALNYSLAYYILIDNPELNPNEAILKSKKMMYGHKKQLFFLNLRYLGLCILCVFTLFLGFLWLMPYIYVSNAAFYEEVKKQYNGE